jgi:hypothetical protein
VSGLNTGSGLTHCGTHAYAPETTYDSGPLSSKLNTSSVGNNKTLTITAVDGAGNTTSKTYTYNVTH